LEKNIKQQLALILQLSVFFSVKADKYELKLQFISQMCYKKIKNQNFKNRNL